MSVGRLTHNMVSRQVLLDLNNATRRITDAQRKISSGKELTRPSDNPFATAKALELREVLEANRQHQRSVQDGIGWSDAVESALGQMTGTVQRARELLIAGANDGPQQARDAIALEIDELASALKQAANAKYQGKFVFSGTATDTPAYGTADTYQGNTATIAREIGPSVSVAINVDARRLLGEGQAAGDDRLLDVLRDMAVNLRAGNGDGLRDLDLPRLDRNLDNLLGVRAENGARYNRLEAAQGRLAEVEEFTIGQLADTEDADYGKVLIEFSTQQAAYQATLKAGANIVQTSLMDFLR